MSKWDTKNVKNMLFIFYKCSSLISIPDISKWNTNNLKTITYLFFQCSSLAYLPDISKWNTNNVKYEFYICKLYIFNIFTRYI